MNVVQMVQTEFEVIFVDWFANHSTLVILRTARLPKSRASPVSPIEARTLLHASITPLALSG
jgi:hypothetical protein